MQERKGDEQAVPGHAGAEAEPFKRMGEGGGQVKARPHRDFETQASAGQRARGARHMQGADATRLIEGEKAQPGKCADGQGQGLAQFRRNRLAVIAAER